MPSNNKNSSSSSSANTGSSSSSDGWNSQAQDASYSSFKNLVGSHGGKLYNDADVEGAKEILRAHQEADRKKWEGGLRGGPGGMVFWGCLN
ncbi:hypothetical protein EJ06DRAFT_579338 [Trichodelitschia bisporula]|uniref:Uncharacterized protein n=1 Tax=Trichodelitschia bisporula TaxID=703511 RepID=A0A6G1I9I4_9PEZI|nr:hypothetical protein EJ06DRAFT_579338 [Trichodelitschia bisporula]